MDAGSAIRDRSTADGCRHVSVPAPPEADGSGWFVRIYEEQRANLQGYLRSMTHDGDAAEDLCQEAFARLHHATEVGRGPIDQVAWLRRVGRNLAISRARRAQVALRHAPQLHEPVGFDPTASVVLERERIDTLRCALQRLPHEQQRLLLLAASGFTGAQLGERLGASPGAIRTRLHRARRQLIGELGDSNDFAVAG